MINFLETSKTASLLKVVWKKYSSVCGHIDDYYKNSRLYRLTERVSGRIAIFIRGSFLEKISRIGGTDARQSLVNNSSLTNWFIGRKRLVFEYASLSRIVSSAREVARAVCRNPIKTFGIVVSCAILVDIFLSLLLKKQIGLSGWVMRAIFLFLGISGYFYAADGIDLEDSSIFFRKIINKGQKQ